MIPFPELEVQFWGLPIVIDELIALASQSGDEEWEGAD
jgi:hypothetical protein